MQLTMYMYMYMHVLLHIVSYMCVGKFEFQSPFLHFLCCCVYRGVWQCGEWSAKS